MSVFHRIYLYLTVLILAFWSYPSLSVEGTDNLTCPDPENLASTFMLLPYSILKTHLS